MPNPLSLETQAAMPPEHAATGYAASHPWLPRAAERRRHPDLDHLKAKLVEADREFRCGNWRRAHEVVLDCWSALDPEATGAPAVVVKGGLTPRTRDRLARYIEDRIAAPLRMAELAGEAGMSVSHFHRAFRQSFGHTPKAYIQMRRVEHAKARMLASGDKLADIAAACGLSDQAALCKLFRRHVGMSPDAWRRHTRA